MSRTRTAGLVVLGLPDIAGLAGFGMDDAPPAWVLLAGGGLGLITLIGVGLAFAGRVGGVGTAITSRVIAAVLGLGAFTDSAAPDWSKVVVVIAIALTVLGVGLVAAANAPPSSNAADP